MTALIIPAARLARRHGYALIAVAAYVITGTVLVGAWLGLTFGGLYVLGYTGRRLYDAATDGRLWVWWCSDRMPPLAMAVLQSVSLMVLGNILGGWLTDFLSGPEPWPNP